MTIKEVVEENKKIKDLFISYPDVNNENQIHCVSYHFDEKSNKWEYDNSDECCSPFVRKYFMVDIDDVFNTQISSYRVEDYGCGDDDEDEIYPIFIVINIDSDVWLVGE